MTKIIDRSWDRTPASQVKAAGFSGVLRYLSHDAGKSLDAAEVADFAMAGLAIGVVWESYARRSLEGFAAGAQDAKDSVAQLAALGMPSNQVVYFAVDFDTTEAQQAPIDDYLRGAASVIGVDRVGSYGSYYIVKRTHDNGTAKWFWQTLAWSGGQIYENNHIYQNGATAFGGGADQNDAVDNWGQAGASSVTPAPAPAVTPAPAPSGDTYTVVAGDTLSGIAAKFGTTYQALAALNGITDPNKINAGQVLKVNGGSAPAPTPQPNGTTYVVKSGDTLGAIGAMFGVDYHIIAQINGIADPNKIYAGQVLRIAGGGVPAPQPNVLYYTVQSGDSLSAIGAHFGVDYNHIAAINGITDPNKIYAGQVLRIA